MSANNDNIAGGIPTRAIHESYLNMLQSMQQYYHAEQEGGEQDLKRAHSRLQQRVLGFFEVLRPHLRTKTAVKEYWEGKPPDYESPGIAVLNTQTQRLPIDAEQLDKQAGGDDWTEKSMDWLHDKLQANYPKLNGNSKIEDLHYEEDQDVLLLQINQYTAGLKHLDGKYNMSKKRVNRGNSFLRHESTETVEKRKMPIDKLFAAAHALQEAADRLNLLVDIKEERSKFLAGGENNEHPEPYGSAQKPS